jgi:lipopolysaccharide biosynthesis protein
MTSDDTASLRKRYKALRKAVLARTPFVRRSRHLRIMGRMEKYLRRLWREEHEKNGAISSLFFAPMSPAAAVECSLNAPVKGHAVDELALFVTHAADPAIKAHVVHHIDVLLNEGIAVLLVVNTDMEPSALDIPVGLTARLHGCLIRANTGYDFAAWAHAHTLVQADSIRRRLYLINDSIIGPLDHPAYRILLQRIRTSKADLVGLTANPDPHEHLQSFYLVFQERLLHSPIFDAFMRSIVNMPTKQLVIDCYEVWLDPYLERCGFRSEAIFPSISTEQHPDRNDTIHRWMELVDAGFPFIKSQVLNDPVQAAAARRLFPSHCR